MNPYKAATRDQNTLLLLELWYSETSGSVAGETKTHNPVALRHPDFTAALIHSFEHP